MNRLMCAFMQGMSQGINSIETDLITPESIANELTAMGLLTGGLAAVHHLIRLTPFRVGPCWHRNYCGLCNWPPFLFSDVKVHKLCSEASACMPSKQ